MRTFVAIELPDEVKSGLESLVERLRGSGARATWVKRDAMHLTLRFLGELGSEQVEALRARLKEGYASIGAFTLEVAGIGAFPTMRRPSVVWAGVRPLEGALAAAQAVSEDAAGALGLLPERKPFHPHLTLARIKDPAQGRLMVPALQVESEFGGGEFEVRNVVLFSSRLTPMGPIHEPIEEYLLRWTT